MTNNNSTSSIVSKIWAFCNTLRDDGVGYGDYLGALTYLLFLKMADEYNKPQYNRTIQIPVTYSWETLTNKVVMKWKYIVLTQILQRAEVLRQSI